MSNKFIFSFFIILLAISFLGTGCTMIPDAVEQEQINEVETTEVETTEENKVQDEPENQVEPENVSENVIEPTTETEDNTIEDTVEASEPEPEPEPELIMYFTEQDVIAMAKVIYREAGGIPSDIEKACVAWVACNRVDAGYGDTIYEVLTAPYQFAWIEDTPVREDLYALALDVLTKWNNEKNGFENVGRVLPSDYLWFYGDGYHNHFRNAYSGNFNIWDYSLNSPYDS